MRFTIPILQIAIITSLIAGAVLALGSGGPSNGMSPSPAALEKGSGALDGMTFTTTLAPQGKPGAIQDAMFFRDGQFLSLECEDRCNYPPSAYFSRATQLGHAFVVEAWCPTKDATMVWRGDIIDGTVSGTVTWTVKRFYWTTGMVLEFTGTTATEAEAAAWRPS